MTRHPRHRAQRGSMVLVVGQLALVLVLFMVSLLIIGKLAIQKDEQQNAVDAVNYAGAIIAKHEGIAAACDDVTLNRLVRANLDWRDGEARRYDIDCAPPVEVDRDGVTRLRFSARVNSGFDNPFAYDDGNVVADPGVDQLTGVAISDIVQAKLSDVELPKVVFVLDYSGSMGRPWPGADMQKVHALREVVNQILDLQLPVEFGAVLFSNRAFGHVEIEYDAEQNDIRNTIEAGPDDTTNYDAALSNGHQLLRNRGAEKGYVIFISDGAPYPEDRDGLDEGRALWRDNHTILSIFIGENSDENRNRMIRLSGSQLDQGNRDYYFEAPDPEDLALAMEDVFKTILCSMGPIEPAPAEGEDLGLLLELEDRSEVPLPQVVNPGELRDQNVYAVHYNPADHYIKLSERACDDILFNNAKVVARHGSPVLLE